MKRTTLSGRVAHALMPSANAECRGERDMDEQLYDTWNINNRINLYMLDAIAPELLGLKLTRGRSVGEQFAHIHNVRLMYLQPAAPELMTGLAKVEKQDAGDKELLRRSLEGSGRAIEALLRKSVANGGKVKSFKPHVTAFLGYMIAHDAHTRAEASFILTQSGHKLDDLISYGLWDWAKR
jgi:uncharacterized damage-inducible protein DinB